MKKWQRILLIIVMCYLSFYLAYWILSLTTLNENVSSIICLFFFILPIIVYNFIIKKIIIRENLKEKIRLHNDNIANIKINDAYNLIGNIEDKKIDKQQMKCIIKDTHNNLVIAGAGTGKTTTIVGKVKYLLKIQECNPEDILVLSFTNASASEMKERIAKETGADITACTFHKLGLSKSLLL